MPGLVVSVVVEEQDKLAVQWESVELNGHAAVFDVPCCTDFSPKCLLVFALTSLATDNGFVGRPATRHVTLQSPAQMQVGSYGV